MTQRPGDGHPEGRGRVGSCTACLELAEAHRKLPDGSYRRI
jgi:hypothetical protein